MAGLLRREGVVPRVSGFLFKFVFYSVLLFSAETWVVTPRMGWFLGGVPGPGGMTVDRDDPAEMD